MNISLLSAAFLAGAVSLVASQSTNASQCLCLPGDDCWPNEVAWAGLNETVDGRLVEVVPIGAVCHDPYYDFSECKKLRDSWDDVSIHYESTSSLMTAYFTGQTCDPFAPRDEPCTIGNYNAYTVDAASRADLAATLAFAREHSIRFVIRNTGHDFYGRSVGYGGLAVRTSNLKDMELLDWDDGEHYSGPALKMGAGVMGYEAQEFLEPHGHVLVAGYCPSVGPAGGYVQGGGHGPLSSVYGLAADNALAYEVLTADGEVVTASQDENADLFWALNGGGAGTWGVVLSATFRVHPQAPMAGASLFVARALMPDEDLFWEMVGEFYALVPTLTDEGVYVTYAFGPDHFGFFPLSAYNKTADQVEALLEPFTSWMKSNRVPARVSYNEHDTYTEHIEENMTPSQPTREYPSGGRIIPREVLKDEERRAELVDVMRRIVGTGALTSSTVMRPIQRTNSSTSVHPAWRDADALIIMTWPWEDGEPEEMQDKVELFRDELAPLLTEVAPDGGSYSNEADAFMPDWQHEMYAENWEELLEVKDEWDPEGVFWSWHTPGADNWNLDTETGRLCKS